MRGAAGVALLLAAMAAAPPRAAAQYPSKLDDLDDFCVLKLDTMWERYNSTGAVDAATVALQYEPCVGECLADCGAALRRAIASTSGGDCPTYDTTSACFRVYKNYWMEYVTSCELFFHSCATAEAEGEGGAACADAEAAAEAGRRRLMSYAQAVRHQRALLAEAESEATGYGAGCFPKFTSAEQFMEYVDGEAYGDQPSNAWGVSLSVLYWVALAALGWYLSGGRLRDFAAMHAARPACLGGGGGAAS